jgi:hypothetical protein
MKEHDLRKLERLMAAVALTVAAPVALAADLNPSQIGSACPAGTTGTWHFVNNQTGGAAAGLLTAVFADSINACVVGPSGVNANVQHFFCSGVGGPLTSASTNLPGRLVLSSLTCTTAPPPPPPPPPPPCGGKDQPPCK